jgi:nucleoside recognition membrane protein YjiH
MTNDSSKKWSLTGIIAFCFACIFFSGLLQSKEWWGIFDFLTLAGNFGKVVHSVSTKVVDGHVVEVVAKTTSFRGSGGAGATDGFLFALTLAPMVIFAMGVFAIIEHLGALEVARRLMEPLFRPLLGIPGICGLTALGSFQTVDVGAAMTNDLMARKLLNRREKTLFTQFQFCAGGLLTNFLMTGAVLLATAAATHDGTITTTSIGLVLVVNFVMKILATNLLRLYMALFDKKFDERTAAMEAQHAADAR